MGTENENKGMVRKTTPDVWHPADRDWNIIATAILTLLFLVVAAVFVTGIQSSFPTNLFFLIFSGFLAFVSVFFFYNGRRLSGFRVALLPTNRSPAEMAEKLKQELVERVGGAEEMDAITGHTFGLLSHIKTLRFESGDIVEMNRLHVGAGFALGLYLLVKAREDSEIWHILEKYIR